MTTINYILGMIVWMIDGARLFIKQQRCRHLAQTFVGAYNCESRNIISYWRAMKCCACDKMITTRYQIVNVKTGVITRKG
jgi:hypothetical protein